MFVLLHLRFGTLIIYNYLCIYLFIYLFHYGKIEITHLKVTLKFEFLKILEYTKISFKKSVKETYTFYGACFHPNFNFQYLLLFL